MDVTKINILIAKFMGYHWYPNQLVQTYGEFRGEPDPDYERVNILSKSDKLEYTPNDAPRHWDLPPVVSTPFLREDQLQYHSSWAWLMPVVEAIENLDNSKSGYSWSYGDEIRYNNEGFSVEISDKSCAIWANLALDPPILEVSKKAQSKIQATWEACGEFIEKYFSDSI